MVDIQACDILPMNANRSRVRLLQADDDPQQDALAGATAPEHRQSLAAAHAQADPVQDLLTSEGLMQVADEIAGALPSSAASSASIAI